VKQYHVKVFSKKVIAGIPWTLVAATCAVLLFRAVCDEIGVFTSVFNVLKGLGISELLFALIFPFIVGFVSALPTTAIPLTFPLVLPMLSEMNTPIAVSLVYSCGVAGYLLSPLHMCLLLTNSYYKAELTKTYRYWVPTVLITLLGGILSIFLINWLS